MFDPLKVSHSEVVSRLRQAIARLNRRDIGDAFLSSMSTRRLDWRSAFGSYVVFQHLSDHESGDADKCATCGLYLQASEDLNVLNFERLKWGGVRHAYPVYALLDLELFLSQPRPRPNAADIAIFDALLKAIESVPPQTTSASLEKFFPSVLKSNKAERDVIVALLGYCGVLETPEHTGFSNHFVPVTSRELPNRRFVDMTYPACWWRREDGINSSALRDYLGYTSRTV